MARSCERHAATVSIFDGGFVLGDGVWEGLRLHNGVLLFLNQHLDRLYQGAAKIRLDIGLDRHALTAEIRRTLEANGMHHGVHIRLMVTRGEKSAPNQDPRNALGRPTVVIVAEYKEPEPNLVTRGLSLHTASIRCTPADMFDMRLNSHSRLNLIMALLEAIDAGADEALMLDPARLRLELQCDEFLLRQGRRSAHLDRRFLFQRRHARQCHRAVPSNGIPIRLGNFTLGDVYGAEEAFVTGTFGGLTPVREIDGHRLACRPARPDDHAAARALRGAEGRSSGRQPDERAADPHRHVVRPAQYLDGDDAVVREPARHRRRR